MSRADPLLLAIDQGTTSTRAIVFDRTLAPVASAARPLETRHPQPGWVEQDADAILDSVVDCVAEVLDRVDRPERIAAVGLDNQGETVVAWDAGSGRPLAPAIVWQCRRSAPIVDRLRGQGLESRVRSVTGLPLDPYYSAGKLTWLLENVVEVQAAAARGRLRFGTVDAWLTARLGDRGPLTDPSTASRTQLFSLRTRRWHPDLLDWFGVDGATLPTVVPTVGDAGTIGHSRWPDRLPLRALACDQQAALAGHAAFTPGALKATYGTGVFVLANAGGRAEPVDGLEASIGWAWPDGTATTVLQGGVFTAGALIDWLRDDLGLIRDPAETEDLATGVSDTAGVMMLPALAGLAAPWWRPEARAVISGLTAAAGRGHIVRAALDGIAHRVADVVETMLPSIPTVPKSLRVDGGLTANRYLMARQADLLGLPVEVVTAEESTALGIAGLAGIGVGIVDELAIVRANPVRTTFEPRLAAPVRQIERDRWRAFAEAASTI